MKNLIICVSLILLTSCNKRLMEFCKQETKPEYELCMKKCELALPQPGEDLDKNDAIKKCQNTCKIQRKEDRLNCYHSELVACARKCAKKKAKLCRENKKNCKKAAREQKRNCIRSARTNKRNCIRNCKNNSRGKKRRRCKRDCRRVFRGEKRACRRTFKVAMAQCKSVGCKKSSFADECLGECTEE